MSGDKMNRRRLLKMTAASATLCAGSAHGLKPIARKGGPKLDLALSAYSLRNQMRWMKGRPTKGDLSLADFLDYCRETEVQGAELTSYFFQSPVTAQVIEALKTKAANLDLAISGGAIGNNFTSDPGSESAKKQLKETRDWIDHYAALGAPVIRVFGGNPPKGMTEERAVRNIVANMTEALGYAAQRQVRLAIENHDFLTKVDRLLALLAHFDSPWFGVNLDSGNLAPTADPYGDLEKLIPFAINVQLKVHIPVNGKKEKADFPRLINLLEKGRYQGYVVLEYEDREDPMVAIPRYLEELRKAMG
jgi:sugar phosphate isomerase/epimerase